MTQHDERDYSYIDRGQAVEWMMGQHDVPDPHPEDRIHVFFLIQWRLTGETVAVPAIDRETHKAAMGWIRRQEQPELFQIKTIVERTFPAKRDDRKRRPRGAESAAAGPAHAQQTRRRFPFLPVKTDRPRRRVPFMRSPEPQITGSLWNRIGTEGLAHASGLLYVRIFGPLGTVPFSEGGDPFLIPFFLNGDGRYPDRIALQNKMTGFLIHALGGPKKYDGRAMEVAHAGRRITDKAFNVVVVHLVAVLRELELSEELIAEVGAAVEPLRHPIVSVPTQPEPPEPSRVPRPLG